MELGFKARLRKIQLLSHHFLIPSTVEFFVGDIPDGFEHILENVRYTRLGYVNHIYLHLVSYFLILSTILFSRYVTLSDNAKTNFLARELKSVHVDAVGKFVKLVIHKNYINRHNLYNQVCFTFSFQIHPIALFQDDLRIGQRCSSEHNR